MNAPSRLGLRSILIKPFLAQSGLVLFARSWNLVAHMEYHPALGWDGILVVVDVVDDARCWR